MSKKATYDVIVIGGGASGMMAAIAAAENGQSVLLLEKNARLGEKLRITGGGRCNIWNEEHDQRLLVANYGDKAKFLHSSFARFGLDETIKFFHEIGLMTKVEAKKRAFPRSENANDVADSLVRRMKDLGVVVRRKSSVKNFNSDGVKITSVLADGENHFANRFILATGGASRPETGSSGDGFAFLTKIGHTIHEPTPTITPLKAAEAWLKKLSGVTLKDVRIRFITGGKTQLKLDGDVLCTHFGISGPLILNNAWRVAELLKYDDVTAEIDLYSHLDEKQLDEFIIAQLESHGAKQLKNTLKHAIPEGVAAGVLEATTIDLAKNTADLTRDERRDLARLMKSMPLSIEGLMGFDRAVVADGGVDVQEIDMKTMQSKLIKNLYITGDLLHINRPSGGYSLQLCWTTGYLAGAISG